MTARSARSSGRRYGYRRQDTSVLVNCLATDAMKEAAATHMNGKVVRLFSMERPPRYTDLAGPKQKDEP